MTGPNLIITGFPRSGTSYICSVIDAINNTVVINEPDIMPTLLRESGVGAIASYYEKIRDSVIAGETLENRVLNNRLIEDTAVVNASGSYHPATKGSNFLVATKYTLLYLPWMHAFKGYMPNAKVVALVRHPLDVIASWKETFSHLKKGSINHVPLEKNRDLLKQWQTAQLVQMNEEEDDATRRALLWNFLARTILESRDDITTIKYEELVRDPEGIVTQTLNGFFPVCFTSRQHPSSIRKDRRKSLTRKEVSMIRSTCPRYAKELGYSLSRFAPFFSFP